MFGFATMALIGAFFASPVQATYVYEADQPLIDLKTNYIATSYNLNSGDDQVSSIFNFGSFNSILTKKPSSVAFANFSPPGVKNKPVACFLTNNCIENSCSSCDIAADMDGEDMFNCFAARDTLLVSVTVKKYLSCFNENLNLSILLVLYPNSFQPRIFVK